MPEHRNGKPTLEDILKARREQQPSPEFWRKFDRELDLKRRQLAQKRLAADSLLANFLSARLTRFAATAAAVSCGTIALYMGLQPESQETSTPDLAYSQAAVEPRFEIADDTPQASLREFATMGTNSRPRIRVIESTAHLARAEEKSDTRDTLASLPNGLDRLQVEASFASSLLNEPLPSGKLHRAGAFEDIDPEALANDVIRSFEQEFAMGKYADPLSSMGYNNPNEALPVIAPQGDSFGEIERYLSNSRSSSRDRNIDSLTLKF